MHHFFAYMARMKQILRWGLMRNTRPENDQEHSLQAAMIAHALATMKNVRHGGNLDANRIAVLAMYHDAGEVITGDLATPIKHFNPEVHGAFERMEQMARRRLLGMLPDDLSGAYAPFVCPEVDEFMKLTKRRKNGVTSRRPIKSARISNASRRSARATASFSRRRPPLKAASAAWPRTECPRWTSL